MFAYFNRGADRTVALHLPPVLPETHLPRVTWLPQDPNTGRRMEEFNKTEITREYLNGWYSLHAGYRSGGAEALKDYNTKDHKEKLAALIGRFASDEMKADVTDLEHHIRLHYFSADGQLISFTDQNVLFKSRIYDVGSHSKVGSVEYRADFDVIMILADGHWRIRSMVKKPASDPPQDTTVRNDQNMVRMGNNGFVYNGTSFKPYGVNYYPSKTPWKFFWDQFDSTVITRDFEVMRLLGFNTVRIFIGYEDFRKGIVPVTRMSLLNTLLNIADAKQLKVIVTLFDFFGDYSISSFSGSDRQLEAILTGFKNHPAILAWDLKNEPDLDFFHHDRQDVEEWLQWILQRARLYDPNHLLTVGWAFPENAHLFRQSVDFISFHYYKDPAQLGAAISELKKKTDGKTVVLEECGHSTYKGIWAPRGSGEKGQAEYLLAIQKALKANGDIPLLIWTLYDFETIPESVVGRLPWHKAPQGHFGILRSDGTPKKVVGVLNK